LESFGKISSGVDAFIDTFGEDIRATFNELGDFMGSAVEKALKFFSDKGIPFILSFVKLADSIGMAFQDVFNFITGGGQSAFGGLEDAMDSLTMFVLNFGKTFKAGILNSVVFVVEGVFKLISKFNNFIGEAIASTAKVAEYVGFLDEGTAQAITDAFNEQGATIEGWGKSLAKPMADEFEKTTDEMAKVFEKNEKESAKYQSRFNKSIDSFSAKWASASEDVKKVQGENQKAVKELSSLSEKRTGILTRGSQEEASVRSQSQAQLDVMKQQLAVQKKTQKTLSSFKEG
jgi:hypothetical protein